MHFLGQQRLNNPNMVSPLKLQDGLYGAGLADTRMSILDFIGAKDDGGGGNNWSYKTCKAPIKMSPPTTNKPTPSVFTGRMPFLSPNQQCQSAEGKISKYPLWIQNFSFVCWASLTLRNLLSTLGGQICQFWACDPSV